jgi:hypothetical protein
LTHRVIKPSGGLLLFFSHKEFALKSLILVPCLLAAGAIAFADALPPRQNHTTFIVGADASELNASLTPTAVVKRTFFRRGQVTSRIFRSSTGLLQIVCDVAGADNVRCVIQTSDGRTALPIVSGD